MLRFLLDEHISPAVCSMVRQRRSGIEIESVLEWKDGVLRGRSDEILLKAASDAGFALVTYDLRTIPVLLRAWSASGLSHQGVIFLDVRTVAPQDLAGIAAALVRVWDAMGKFEWKDRAAFASRR